MTDNGETDKMKSYRRSDQKRQMHTFRIRYTLASPRSIGHYYRYDDNAISVEDVLKKLIIKAKDYGQVVASIDGIWKDGKKISSSQLKAYDEKFCVKDYDFNECDAGGVGGDASGAAGGGDIGDIAGEMPGTSTTDVLGTFKPGKGVLGPGNFMMPVLVKHPLHRWEVANGGSKRKKGKNGKPKKYDYEKGMKVVVKMFEDDVDASNIDTKKLNSKLHRIAKGIKSIDDVKAVEAKIRKDKSSIESRLSKSSSSQTISFFKDFYGFIRDICNGSYKASWFIVSMVVVGLVYVLSPIDIIPDVVPVVGLFDDAYVLKLIYDVVKDEMLKWKDSKK